MIPLPPSPCIELFVLCLCLNGHWRFRSWQVHRQSDGSGGIDQLDPNFAIDGGRREDSFEMFAKGARLASKDGPGLRITYSDVTTSRRILSLPMIQAVIITYVGLAETKDLET